MRDLFILGAGFSKAICQDMPTMEELSTQVLSDLKEFGWRVPSELYDLGNNIELWMTYLSQAQPWLQDHEVYSNLATARQIRKRIKEIIDTHTLSTAQSAAPDWLNLLLRSWHDGRANVLTLNYDTLVERATREFLFADKTKGISPRQMYPPHFADIRSRVTTLWPERPIDTFSYLKLHGSVNWYYSGRDDFYGETIFYSEVLPLGEDPLKLREHEEAFRVLSEDKDTLIIPPVNEKITYFNNETERWLGLSEQFPGH